MISVSPDTTTKSRSRYSDPFLFRDHFLVPGTKKRSEFGSARRGPCPDSGSAPLVGGRVRAERVEGVAQRGPGSYTELGEDAVEVTPYRSM
jgi:hypothetical protein